MQDCPEMLTFVCRVSSSMLCLCDKTSKSCSYRSFQPCLFTSTCMRHKTALKRWKPQACFTLYDHIHLCAACVLSRNTASVASTNPVMLDVGSKLTLRLKSSCIHLFFLLTLDQRTECNVKRVTCDDEPTEKVLPDFMEGCSVFQLIVLVFWAETLLFLFNLTDLINLVSRCNKSFFWLKSSDKPAVHHLPCTKQQTDSISD